MTWSSAHSVTCREPIFRTESSWSSVMRTNKRDQGVVLVLWSIRCVRPGPKVETMQQNLEDTNKDFQEPTTISKQEALGMTMTWQSVSFSDLVHHPKVTPFEHLHTRMEVPSVIESWRPADQGCPSANSCQVRCKVCMLPSSLTKWIRKSPDKCSKLEQLTPSLP